MKRETTRANNMLIAYRMGCRIDKDGEMRNKNGEVIKGSVLHGRYRYITYYFNGKHIKVFHHQLQAYTKFGEKVFEVESVRHFNGDSFDNSYDNILIGSQSENLKDTPAKDVVNHSKTGVLIRNRFTDEEKEFIYLEYIMGTSQIKLAKKYDCPLSTMSELTRKMAKKYKRQVA